MIYDLEERTIRFSNSVISFCRLIQKDLLLRPIAYQLLRSATSVGANYSEANGAVSKKDFKNKIHICKKEAQETRYWLRVLEKEMPESGAVILELFNENQELIKIFASIAEKSK